MRVRLHVFSILRECLPPDAHQGQVEVDLPDGATLRDLIGRFGMDQRLGVPPGGSLAQAGWQVLVNGAYVEDLSRTLSEGDEVSIFPPMAGG
ncbi:MAG: MoaD/ThiS family protein [Anaerolineae bacterium]|nr:MoaD/ThiS family protein [Anaerolineae bacterium]